MFGQTIEGAADRGVFRRRGRFRFIQQPERERVRRSHGAFVQFFAFALGRQRRGCGFEKIAAEMEWIVPDVGRHHHTACAAASMFFKLEVVSITAVGSYPQWTMQLAQRGSRPRP